MTSLPADPGDPTWDDHRSPAQRWSDEWAIRACEHPAVAHQGFVFTRTQCRLSDAEIRSRIRRRIWWVPRWGVLSVIHPNNDAKVAAALQATAAAIARPGSVISHESAAILHGIDVLNQPRVAVLTTLTGDAGGNRAGIYLHNAGLTPADKSTWYGADVTSPARTVADIARRGRIIGLVSADAALREQVTTPTAIANAIGRAMGWPGARAARWVRDHADGRSESPLESITRGRLIEAGLPVPELQVWIPGTNARVDLLYRESRLVIEADGLGKYDKADVLRAEKRRQVALERADHRVIRVLWDQVISDPSEFITAVRAAM